MRVIVGALLVLASAGVQAKVDREGYDTCILEHVSVSENTTASDLMTNACHRLYIDNFMLSEKDQAYFGCLLEYLPAAKNDKSALQVKSSCNSRHRSLFK